MPFSFILVLGVAYFGPNGHLFGNIRITIWTFSAIENINETIMSLGKFFVVDFTSTLACATILWVCCRINVWKAFLLMQKEFGKFFLIQFSYCMIVVSISNHYQIINKISKYRYLCFLSFRILDLLICLSRSL